MADKKDKMKLLTYKNKPLVRQGNVLYYGNPDAKYIVSFVLSSFTKTGDLEMAEKVVIQLQQNDEYLNPKNRLIKKAERDGLWSAIDIGAFWLEDAIERAQ